MPSCVHAPRLVNGSHADRQPDRCRSASCLPPDSALPVRHAHRHSHLTHNPSSPHPIFAPVARTGAGVVAAAPASESEDRYHGVEDKRRDGAGDEHTQHVHQDLYSGRGVGGVDAKRREQQREERAETDRDHHDEE